MPVLCQLLFGGLTPSLRAEDVSPASKANARKTSSDQTFTVVNKQNQLQAELESTKTSRNVLMGLGTVGSVVGLSLMLNGQRDVKDAENTPGCSSNGSLILCGDQDSTDAANNKLDDGQTKIIKGGIVGAVGAGLFIWGLVKWRQSKEIEERLDAMKAQSWTIDYNKDRVLLVWNRKF